LADRDTGRLSTPLPFGLIKVKTLIARTTKQRVLLLDSYRVLVDRAAIVQPVATVLPISGIAASHESPAEGMARARGQIGELQQAGSRAVLMVMARSFSDSGSLVTGARPWEGVSVVDSQRETVLVLEHGELQDSGDPFASCVKAVVPGSYFLRQRLDDGTTLEQSIIVCNGWGHEVYVLRRVGPGKTTLRPRPRPRPRVSVMMRRLDQAEPPDVEDRLIEAARVAFADERRILNAEFEDLLMRKLENPIAGIIGAHLLLVEPKRDPGRDLSLLDTVVRSRYSLVGTDHPDVVALALQCADPKLRRTIKTVVGPPMLQRSWKLLAVGAQKRSRLIHLARWERVQALTALPPFLAWAADDAVKSAVRKDLARAVLGEYEAPARTPAEPAFAIELEPRRRSGSAAHSRMDRRQLG
jgi:hypothetical protein